MNLIFHIYAPLVVQYMCLLHHQKELKMGPQHRLGIYVGFNSPSIIRFLEPTTGDLFTARFADCHFNETTFPSIGTPKIDFMMHLMMLLR